MSDRRTRSTDNDLAHLEARVRRDLEILDYPHQEWTRREKHPSGCRVYDVAICGAGQGGLAVAFALRREQVRNILVIDAASRGREGPWGTFARMRTLRTPKYLAGPEMGVPSLAYRSWHEAHPTKTPWAALERIATKDWTDYLRWFRRVTTTPVQNETRLIDIRPAADGLLDLSVERRGQRDRYLARKLVLATGLDGGGAWSVPAGQVRNLPGHVWRRADADIDFTSLRGKRVGVLGFGASAVDNACVALEQGVARVDLFSRKASVPVFSDARGWLEHTGFLRHFADLEAAQRWRLMLRYHAKGSPPPRWSLERARRHVDFHLHFGAPWLSTQYLDNEIRVETPLGSFAFDFAIVATGVVTDLTLRPELQSLAPLAATWADRYSPEFGEEDADMFRHPYLGRGMEFMAREGCFAPWLSNIHLFNWAATTSVGINASSITGLKFGVTRLVAALTRDLYFAVADQHAARLPDFATIE